MFTGVLQPFLIEVPTMFAFHSTQASAMLGMKNSNATAKVLAIFRMYALMIKFLLFTR
jgi:hypothetical protein